MVLHRARLPVKILTRILTGLRARCPTLLALTYFKLVLSHTAVSFFKDFVCPEVLLVYTICNLSARHVSSTPFLLEDLERQLVLVSNSISVQLHADQHFAQLI